ncbi:MAG: DNA repair protein RecO [Bacteroidales bacterium]|nr:DNA repair protein RecO [Bacteroidales bacterium]MCF6341308.1 DNA repair protein RecO [Bacteroidales bacterium]
MFYTTRGIVFQSFKYSESSIIAKVFTEEFGLQSYMVKGVRSKRSRFRPALFQPLTLVELVVSHKENKTMNHLRDIRVAYAFQSIPLEMEKRSVLFFLNELLYRSIREETPNKPLFGWLFDTLTWFDLNTTGNVNFHLVFMLQLSRFLGFHPKKTPGKEHSVFDLQEGRFTNVVPRLPQYITGNLLAKLEMLHESSFENSRSLELNNNDRRKLVDILITYYRLHLPGFGEMKSLEVLKTILA